jgi:periplasmic protein TonB
MWKLGLLALAGASVAGAAMACNDHNAPPAVSTRAKVNLANLISDEDYPAAARAAGEQGFVDFNLDIGANGRVTACTVTRSSGSAALDLTTCRLMRSRARFTPAVDSNGTPVADRISGKIGWKLPPEPAG